jgi:hypothetical protein
MRAELWGGYSLCTFFSLAQGVISILIPLGPLTGKTTDGRKNKQEEETPGIIAVCQAMIDAGLLGPAPSVPEAAAHADVPARQAADQRTSFTSSARRDRSDTMCTCPTHAGPMPAVSRLYSFS